MSDTHEALLQEKTIFGSHHYQVLGTGSSQETIGRNGRHLGCKHPSRQCKSTHPAASKICPGCGSHSNGRQQYPGYDVTCHKRKKMGYYIKRPGTLPETPYHLKLLSLQPRIHFIPLQPANNYDIVELIPEVLNGFIKTFEGVFLHEPFL